MNSALSLTLQVFGLFNLADFIAGFIHWFEDAYIDEQTPMVGSAIGRPNVIHHHLPRYFTKLSWWESNWMLHVIAGLLILIAWRFDFLGWQVWCFALIAANANEIHKWSHRTRAENGPVISFLQDLRLLQTPAHHARHHTDPKDSHYCPVGNLVNPFLDTIGFWAGLERLLDATLGLRRREDSSVHGHGHAPDWIQNLRPSRPSPAPQPRPSSHECHHDHTRCPHHGNCPVLRGAGHGA
jgi:hypothetical protein